jgi:hypothetical protein
MNKRIKPINKTLKSLFFWLFFILVTFIVILPDVVLAGWLFGPQNAQECIQKFQKNAESKLASRAIHIACDYKFNKKINIKYSNCILEHVGNTKSDLAIRAIAGACSNLYIKDEKKTYSECILKNMPGIDVDLSARSIIFSCQ